MRPRDMLLFAAFTFAAPISASPTSERPAETSGASVVSRAFAGWAAGETSFFDILSDDVVWTVMGSGPSAGVYRGKADFLARAVTPFAARLSAPLRPTVRAIYSDGDVVVVLWDGEARTRDGETYRNSYAWFLTVRRGKVVAAKAFLDLPAYDAVLRRVRPAARP